MFENLSVFENRYEELNMKLYDPAVAADRNLYRDLMKEHKEIEPIVEKYRALKKAEASLEDAEAILNDSEADKELRQMASDEMSAAKSDIESISEELKILLLPRDPNDDRSVIVEIRGGAGGEEAALFAYNLYRMYNMYAEKRGWKTEIVSLNETELGGFKEVSFTIDGDGAYSRLKFESGVHRVQRVPETETQGRVHTSTATVAVLPEVDDVEIEINPKDLQIDTFRSSGAGGQYVNMTDSAVRITHIPSGIIVSCQTERSQHMNRATAMQVLRSKLFERTLRERQEQLDSIQGEKRSIAWGSQIRSYTLQPFQLVKDHRSGCEIGNVQAVLDGSLDELIMSYLRFLKNEK